MKRILVTGSRDWPDEKAVWLGIEDQLGVLDGAPCEGVIVHGDCPTGADRMAREWCERAICDGYDIREERHPADWRNCAAGCDPRHRKRRADGSTYCPTAGFRRNIEMVDLGADFVLAFHLNKSRGTAHTIFSGRKGGDPGDRR